MEVPFILLAGLISIILAVVFGVPPMGSSNKKSNNDVVSTLQASNNPTGHLSLSTNSANSLSGGDIQQPATPSPFTEMHMTTDELNSIPITAHKKPQKGEQGFLFHLPPKPTTSQMANHLNKQLSMELPSITLLDDTPTVYRPSLDVGLSNCQGDDSALYDGECTHSYQKK